MAYDIIKQKSLSVGRVL